MLSTDFLRRDMNDVTILHALCIEKNIGYREGWYGFRKPQCGDPEHRITLCEIYSIKTKNIDGYIIKPCICHKYFIRIFAAVIWLKYYQYGTKTSSINHQNFHRYMINASNFVCSIVSFNHGTEVHVYIASLKIMVLLTTQCQVWCIKNTKVLLSGSI